MTSLENAFRIKEENIATKETLYSNSNKQLKIAILGSSDSVMRNGYSKYLQEDIAEITGKNVELSYFSLGGVTSLFGAIQNFRYKISKNHDIIFFEYCINDRGEFIAGKYTLSMAGMALEGFIRQAKSMNPNCVIIILIFGINLPRYYNNCCQISAIYESVARRYEIPVINITEILLATKGIQFIKGLYIKDDPVHYARPNGTKIIARVIAEQIAKHNLINQKSQDINKYYRMYARNLQNLNFFSNFDSQLNQNNIEKSTFKNRLYEEDIYTIKANAVLNLKFKGRLLGLMLKSDWHDGIFQLKLGDQELITSSFSEFIKNKSMNNINLLSLPYKKFKICNEFNDLSISIYHKKIENYELGMHNRKPKVNSQKWKLSIVGIAYIGEINIINFTKSTSFQEESNEILQSIN